MGRMRRLLLLTAMSACGGLAHVQPAIRTDIERRATVVRVHSVCPGFFESDGTGVVVSEAHVLTAAHVVFCPGIPRVSAALPDGSWFSMEVERDDAMFGSGADLARLRLVGAYDRFGLHVPPPAIARAHVYDTLCLQPFGREGACGHFEPYDGRMTFQVPSRPGDSGSPVYLDGFLVGLLTKGGPDGYSEYVPVDYDWLEGT